MKENLGVVVVKSVEVMSLENLCQIILRKPLSFPLADHLHSELKKRFDPTSTKVYNGLYIIHTKMIWSLSHPGELNWKEKFSLFSSLYVDDLPKPLALDGELELWEKYWLTKNTSHPDNISCTLKAINFPGFEKMNWPYCMYIRKYTLIFRR